MRAVGVIFTDQDGPLVNRTLKLKYTHVLVDFDGMYYEATVPRVRKTTQEQPKNVHTVTRLEVYVDEADYAKMLEYAESQLGRIYMCRGFFFPKVYGKTEGIYCSEYACYILMAGRYLSNKRAGYSPDTLFTAITGRKP